MKFFLTIFILFSSVTLYSQQLGEVKNGLHTLKLHKVNNEFSITYSDVKSESVLDEHTFKFPYEKTVYNLMMYGFNKQREHQLIIQTSTDTIVKFEYKKILGKWMLKIKQNNLKYKKHTSSTFFTKSHIITLFDQPELFY